MKNTYRSTNDQTKLKILCDNICDEIEPLLEHFGIEYKHAGRMITMCCPIHGGDNPSAINLYPEGDNYRGNWKCRTHGCEKFFKASIIGFIRGVVSHKKLNWEKNGDKAISFDEALKIAQEFVKKDLSDISISGAERNKARFNSTIRYLSDGVKEKEVKIKRESVVKSLQIPAQYYLDRGYSVDVLKKYDVGLCFKDGKEMSHRVVVPIYDNDYENMVGCSGRSVFEKCTKCSAFHHPAHVCPTKETAWIHSKWRHSKDFKSQNYLYNFWFAKKLLFETGTAIIVESPGNVWRLEENGIHNSVAIFGSSMSDRQKILLDSSGAMNLVVLTDNDDAGRKAAEQIQKKCENTYKVFIPKISKNDVGEMTGEEIQNEIVPLLEKIA